MVLSYRGKNNNDGSFSWGDAIIDAIISAGLGFFSSLSAAAIIGVANLLAATISAGMQFCITLAMKRGLRPKPETKAIQTNLSQKAWQ